MFGGGHVAERFWEGIRRRLALSAPAGRRNDILAAGRREPRLPLPAQPKVSPLPASRFLIDSSSDLEPVWSQLAAGASPKVDCPAPAAGRKPTRNRLPTPAASGDRFSGHRLPVRTHVAHVLAALHHSDFEPGEAIEPARMRAIYEHICAELGWRPHAWNMLARELKFAMGRGARGAAKTYVKVIGPDGRDKPARAYIVPDRPAGLRRDTGESQPAIIAQSIPHELRRAA